MKKKIGVGLGVSFPCIQQSGLIIKIYHASSWTLHQSQYELPCLACGIISWPQERSSGFQRRSLQPDFLHSHGAAIFQTPNEETEQWRDLG